MLTLVEHENSFVPLRPDSIDLGVIRKSCKESDFYGECCPQFNDVVRWLPLIHRVLSGRVLALRLMGCRFEPHQRHCNVSLSKTH